MITLIAALALLISTTAIVLNGEGFGKIPDVKGNIKIKNSPNFNLKEGKFINPVPTKMENNVGKFIKAYNKSDSKLRKPQFPVHVNKLTTADFTEKPSQELKMIWLGHASVLLELEGKRILIDPVLSGRASPVSWVGVKRLHEAPVQAEDLPAIDVIVISHNHYDHLDHQTIKKLAAKNIKFMVPLGVGLTLQSWGVPIVNIQEFDWHDSLHYKDIYFIATPARHFTNRGLWDRDKTLWTSWVIKGKNTNVYFSGDSGMFPGFKDIGDKYGPFDLSMIGIGAYDSLWHNIHTFPEEAVEAHIMLKAKKLMPIHWATFDLALHPYTEPAEKLLKSAEEKQIQLIMPHVGQVVNVAEFKQNGFWWRKNEKL